VSDDSFLRLQARTARFTLGRPRSFTISADGARVLFLRSRGGTDRVTCLWVYDLASNREVLLADPDVLLAGGLQTGVADALPASERARRERAREQAAGIVAYACDASASVAAFALSGRLFVADTATGAVRELTVRGPVFDPRPDPTARSVAYASDGALRVVSIDGTGDTSVAAEPGVSWGIAEFVAAEEMNRQRGYWWSPDGESMLAARVDESAVTQWHIADPANPARPPNVVRYPAAGTANAAVALAVLGLNGDRIDIGFDADAFPYLVSVRWRQGHRPLALLASRDQRTMRIVEIDTSTGATALVREDHDRQWLEVVDGVPDRLPDGRFVTTSDVDDTRRLVIGDQLVSPAGLQVRAVLRVSDGHVLFSASTEPTQTQLWRWSSGAEQACALLTPEPGVHSGTGSSDVVVVSSASLEFDGARTSIGKNGVQVAEIASFAEPAPFSPSVSISRQGRRELRTALVLPRNHVRGQALPVLMDPYGGPHAQRVVAARGAYLNAQWLADQGFAVVIVDGRGSPGRGSAWEREIAGDLATAVLEDQVEGLQSLAETHRDLDLSRVAIRGWSFGGYLAALAVLRRPDVFHAAVAGAPVTDWSLYDTFYTERYLGTDISAPSYTVSSLIADAAALTRPLMIVHGLADDNVVAAHTLRLSAALLEAGRPHSVLPLAGVTHMTSQEVVAANLVKLEVQFLRNALGLA
jgi:dipeptidyl-peptidase 4